MPDFEKWVDEIIDVKSTQSKFRNIRKWISVHRKSERLGAWICTEPITDQCISSFADRKTLESIKKDKQHHAKHRKERKPYKKVTGFVVYHRNKCLFDDGSTKSMMMIIGEKIHQNKVTLKKYFKPKIIKIFM